MGNSSRWDIFFVLLPLNTPMVGGLSGWSGGGGDASISAEVLGHVRNNIIFHSKIKKIKAIAHYLRANHFKNTSPD